MKPSTLGVLAALAVLITEITPEVRERCADTTCAKLGAALRDVETEISEAGKEPPVVPVVINQAMNLQEFRDLMQRWGNDLSVQMEDHSNAIGDRVALEIRAAIEEAKPSA